MLQSCTSLLLPRNVMIIMVSDTMPTQKEDMLLQPVVETLGIFQNFNINTKTNHQYYRIFLLLRPIE